MERGKATDKVLVMKESNPQRDFRNGVIGSLRILDGYQFERGIFEKIVQTVGMLVCHIGLQYHLNADPLRGGSRVFGTVSNCSVQGIPNCTGQELVWFGHEKLSGNPDHPKAPIPDWYGMVRYRTSKFRLVQSGSVWFGSNNIVMQEERIFLVSRSLVRDPVWYGTIRYRASSWILGWKS